MRAPERCSRNPPDYRLAVLIARPTTRRSFIAQASALLAGATWAKAADVMAPLPEPSFRFLVVNDLHHATAECDIFLRDLIAQMRGHGPVAFCLVVGDLADAGRPESFAAVREIFGDLGAPIFPVPGNHDCDVEQDTRLYSEFFPGRLNYHFAHEGWQFVALDSTDGRNWGETRVRPETFAWLDATLARLDRAAPTVLFTHFPLAVGVHPRLVPLNAGDVLRRFAGYNLRCVFNGHFHARTERGFENAAVVTNTCCSRVAGNHDGTTTEGYLLCTAFPDGKLKREFVEFAPAAGELPTG